MPRPHPPEFRRRAVELARLGEQPTSKIAAELGIWSAPGIARSVKLNLGH